MFVHIHYYKYLRERNHVHTLNYEILSTFALIQRSLCTPLQCNLFVHRHRSLILCARTVDPATHTAMQLARGHNPNQKA